MKRRIRRPSVALALSVLVGAVLVACSSGAGDTSSTADTLGGPVGEADFPFPAPSDLGDKTVGAGLEVRLARTPSIERDNDRQASVGLDVTITNVSRTLVHVREGNVVCGEPPQTISSGAMQVPGSIDEADTTLDPGESLTGALDSQTFLTDLPPECRGAAWAVIEVVPEGAVDAGAAVDTGAEWLVPIPLDLPTLVGTLAEYQGPTVEALCEALGRAVPAGFSRDTFQVCSFRPDGGGFGYSADLYASSDVRTKIAGLRPPETFTTAGGATAWGNGDSSSFILESPEAVAEVFFWDDDEAAARVVAASLDWPG